MHLRSVLAVAAALVVGALIYTTAGGGFPGLSADVRSFLSDQAAKAKLILPGRDVGNLRPAPAPMSPPSFKEAGAGHAPSLDVQSNEHLLYSTASIAFTPLK